VRFYFDAGSNFDDLTSALGQQSGTFDLAQVQLEEGTQATIFELRPLAIETGMCERYYERLGGESANVIADGHIWTATTAYGSIRFKTTKRGFPVVSSPTVTNGYMARSGGANFLSNALNWAYNTPESTRWGIAISGATIGRGCWLRLETGSSFIEVDAEL
jgi:hypothetical protein